MASAADWLERHRKTIAQPGDAYIADRRHSILHIFALGTLTLLSGLDGAIPKINSIVSIFSSGISAIISARVATPLLASQDLAARNRKSPNGKEQEHTHAMLEAGPLQAENDHEGRTLRRS